MDDRLAHGREDVGGGLEVGVVSADHDREHPVDRPGLPTGDGGVEGPDPGLTGLGGELLGDIGRIVEKSIQVAPAGLLRGCRRPR